jgi:hypothetical protein
MSIIMCLAFALLPNPRAFVSYLTQAAEGMLVAADAEHKGEALTQEKDILNSL